VMDNDGHLSLLQVLSMAMGTRPTASLNHARLIRRQQSGYVETSLSLKKVLNGKQQDQLLQADDILYVPNCTGESILYRAAPTALKQQLRLPSIGPTTRSHEASLSRVTPRWSGSKEKSSWVLQSRAGHACLLRII
jgi:hypothetical protein